MKTAILSFLISFTLLAGAGRLPAQVPQLISYQGRVLSNGTNFNGTGQFKFALVQGAGPTLLWKNDGSAGNTEPGAAVGLTVADGLVMTLLGDTTLPNMTAIPTSVFANSDVRLRVWFNGGSGFQQLTPDQRIVSVGYAMMADTVPNGSLSAAKLAPGVLNPTNFPANSVGSAQLADAIELGTSNTVSGRLDVYRTAANTPAVSLIGSSSQISTYGSDGLEQARIYGTGWGQLLLFNSLVANAMAVDLSANGGSGGYLALKNTNAQNRAYLSGANGGGSLLLYESDGTQRANLSGSGTLALYQSDGSTGASLSSGGSLSLYNTNSSLRAQLSGTSTGGSLSLYQADGSTGAFLDGDNSGYGYMSLRSTNGSTRVGAWGGPASGSLALYNKSGNTGVYLWNYGDNAGVVSVRNSAGGERGYLWGDNGNGNGELALRANNGTTTILAQGGEGSTAGSQILMYQDNGTQTVQLDAEVGNNGGGYMGLSTSNGTTSIYMYGQSGTITTRVLEITGGADLSENFDITPGEAALQPGMIVSINPKNPGGLAPSSFAYDKKVAGIISGAGGVNPGMLMGQPGTKASGKHPVALTGRVYCQVDADAAGAVEPGDFITTSARPGHGMKVTDHACAAGAIIGKAMTPLSKGQGLVLVLVNLQ